MNIGLLCIILSLASLAGQSILLHKLGAPWIKGCLPFYNRYTLAKVLNAKQLSFCAIYAIMGLPAMIWGVCTIIGLAVSFGAAPAIASSSLYRILFTIATGPLSAPMAMMFLFTFYARFYVNKEITAGLSEYKLNPVLSFGMIIAPRIFTLIVAGLIHPQKE